MPTGRMMPYSLWSVAVMKDTRQEKSLLLPYRLEPAFGGGIEIYSAALSFPDVVYPV